MEVTDFIMEMKRVEKYPDFQKLVHVIKRGVQGFYIMVIEVREVQFGLQSCT